MNFETKKQLTFGEKIDLIKKNIGLEYTEEEKARFNQWLEKVPENSYKNPITISDISEIEKFLPQDANYTEKPLNLYFTKKQYTAEELHTILENFAKKNPAFEISVNQLNKQLISIGIGNKEGNSSDIEEESFGHYHPSHPALENNEDLPNSFRLSLMPSIGDIRGYLNQPDTIKNGTRIYSKNGYALIQPTEKIKNPKQNLEEFKQMYFDLFLGENKFGFKSDQDTVQYFKDKFGLEIKFNYFD